MQTTGISSKVESTAQMNNDVKQITKSTKCKACGWKRNIATMEPRHPTKLIEINK